jgi:hypothetical protein
MGLSRRRQPARSNGSAVVTDPTHLTSSILEENNMWTLTIALYAAAALSGFIDWG